MNNDYQQMVQDILVDRYLQPGETTFSDVANRVSTFLGTSDAHLMNQGIFLYNSPTLMNAGTAHPMLSACFVLPINDSMDGIFSALKRAAILFKAGGGVGINFSTLRPKGSVVRGTGGTSSGPIEFIEVFNTMVNTVKSGGRRRGAAIAILDCSHPDILEFVKVKADNEDRLRNFNISVLVTNEFMTAVKQNESWDLTWGGKVYETIQARELYDLVIDGMYTKGEPGLLFFDTINQHNPMRGEFGDVYTCNPCGEQLLCVDPKTGGGESCNLGSANLTKFASGKVFNTEAFREVVRTGITGLNAVIDTNEIPLPEVDACTKAGRKVGFGVMGWADLLVKAGVPYTSQEAIDMIALIGRVMQDEALKTSRCLAKQHGPFREGEDRRNACLLNIAPTGTISILANCSSGIEPVYKWVYDRVVSLKEGDRVYRIIHPLYEQLLDMYYPEYKDELLGYAYENGSIQDAPYISSDHKAVFVVASDIDPYWHIRHQATWQQFVDSSISKTCNVASDVTREQIDQLIMDAHFQGIKGFTLLREWSRDDAVMKTGQHENGSKKRDQVLSGKTYKYRSGCGTIYLTVNTDEFGFPIEVLANPNNGGCEASIEAMCRLASVYLREELPLTQIIRQLRKVDCKATARNKRVSDGRSCADIIGRCLEMYIHEVPVQAMHQAIAGPACPDCGSPITYADGCRRCTSCSWSKCG